MTRKLELLKPASPVAPGTHPCAFEFSPDEKTLYVALANRDAVAAVNVGAGHFSVKGYFDTRLPGQSYFGAEPEALAINADGSRLYVANAITDAVAVMDTTKLTTQPRRKGWWSRSGLFRRNGCRCDGVFTGEVGGKLYVATAKGKGTGPNNEAQPETDETKSEKCTGRPPILQRCCMGRWV